VNSELVLCLFSLCSVSCMLQFAMFLFSTPNLYRITTLQNHCSRSFLAA